MGNNDSSVETFLQWIKASDNIDFSAEQVYQPRVAYLISEAWTDFIIRSMIIRPRPS